MQVKAKCSRITELFHILGIGKSFLILHSIPNVYQRSFIAHLLGLGNICITLLKVKTVSIVIIYS